MIRTLVALLVLALLFSAGSMEAGAKETVAADGYTTRSPIYIKTDGDFTAENGVIGGSGTALDPYLISGWHITPEWGLSITSDRAITIGGAVRHSHFVVEDNLIELVENDTKGVSIGTPLGGTVRNNVILASGWVTFGVVVGPGVNDRQNSLHPLQVDSNLMQGRPDHYQTAVVFWGTALTVTSNRIVGFDEGVRVAGSLTVGPQTVAIHGNDFVDVDWAVPAALVQTSTANLPLIDARENYWGHEEGPTVALCTNNFGCNIAPLGEKGAKVAPNVVANPYAEQPFFPEE